MPARENGGNHDIKNFTRGSRVYYPVHVAGANLSGGDLHFSQGDGEITFCGAIEMGGFIDFGVDLIKDGMNKYGVTHQPGLHPRPRGAALLASSSDLHRDLGRRGAATNHYLDATIAYRRACLNAVEYLKKFGYTGEQAYLLLGSAPIEGRISGVVDIPNACCSLYLPTAIFDFDITPDRRRPDRGRPRGRRRRRARPCRSTHTAASAAAASTPGDPSPRRPRRSRAQAAGSPPGGASHRRASPARRRRCGPPATARRAAPTSPRSSARRAPGGRSPWGQATATSGRSSS